VIAQSLLSLVLLITAAVLPSTSTAQELECPQIAGKQSGGTRLSVAVVPQLPPVELFRRWTPVLKVITERTGLCFSLTVPKTIPEFEALFLRGQPDLVFLNPYHQVMAFRAQGYLPILADSEPLTGIIVVRNDSPIKTLRDLNGQTMAFPAPNAFAASLLLRAIITDLQIPFRTQYVQSHSNVYRSVASGTIAAGGGVNNTLMREPQALRNELRVLYESPGFRSHPLSAHPRVPSHLRVEISDVLYKLALNDEGRSLLNQIQIPNPSAATHNKDYAPLERLGIEKFVVSSD